MMIWAQLASLAVVAVLATFAPGFAVVRRLKWSPAERLGGAVGLSLFLVYLGAFGVFLTGAGRWGYAAMTAVFVAAAVYAGRDWVRLLRVHQVRRTVGVLALLTAWAMVGVGLIRHYSGGMWAGDWFLHYQKVGIYLGHVPTDMAVVRDKVIDRPGMMNLIGAYLTGQVGGLRFETFEAAFAWLNVLAVLPCFLMAGMFRRRGGRRVWVVAALLMCLPIVWVNVTYSWTKLLAVFYVLLGIALYRRGVRKAEDGGRVVAAFWALATGVLVHYIALPYGVFTAGHYALLVWRRRERRWREALLSVAGGAVIWGTWFGWTLLRYGRQEMAGANNTLKHARGETGGQWLLDVARNIIWTWVPHPLRMRSGVYVQENWMGYVRDYMFLMYQTNMLLVTGTVMGLVAAWVVWRRLKSKGEADPVGRAWAYAGAAVAVVLAELPRSRNVVFDLFPRMWMLVIPAGVGAWLAREVSRAVRGKDRGVSEEVWYWWGLIVWLQLVAGLAMDNLIDYGVGHVFFHAWAMMAAVLVGVVAWDLPRWVRAALGVGMAVDFTLGVWLQFHLEHRVFRLTSAGVADTGGLARQTWINWLEKEQFGYTFVGDHLAAAGPVLEALLVAGAVAAIVFVVAGPWLCRGRRIARA